MMDLIVFYISSREILAIANFCFEMKEGRSLIKHSPMFTKRMSMDADQFDAQAGLRHVVSREEMLNIEREYFRSAHSFKGFLWTNVTAVDLEQNIMRARRTKITCTVTEKTSEYETLLMMYQAGMNNIRLNMAYCSHEVNISSRRKGI